LGTNNGCDAQKQRILDLRSKREWNELATDEKKKKGKRHKRPGGKTKNIMETNER